MMQESSVTDAERGNLKIVATSRVDQGLVVTFSNGESILYSPQSLYNARQLNSTIFWNKEDDVLD